MEHEAEGPRPRGRPKKTWKEVVREDCQARKLNKEDAMDRCKWRKMIKEARWSGWVWVGECSFWYRPTRVVPDQRPLNGRCCCCCCWHQLDHMQTIRQITTSTPHHSTGLDFPWKVCPSVEITQPLILQPMWLKPWYPCPKLTHNQFSRFCTAHICPTQTTKCVTSVSVGRIDAMHAMWPSNGAGLKCWYDLCPICGCCLRKNWRSCTRCLACMKTALFSMMNSMHCLLSLFSTTLLEVVASLFTWHSWVL